MFWSWMVRPTLYIPINQWKTHSCIHSEYEEQRYLGPKLHRQRTLQERGDANSDPLEGLPALTWDQGKAVQLESSDSPKA